MDPIDKLGIAALAALFLTGACLLFYVVWTEHVEAMRALEIQELQIRSDQ